MLKSYRASGVPVASFGLSCRGNGGAPPAVVLLISALRQLIDREALSLSILVLNVLPTVTAGGDTSPLSSGV